MSALLGNNRILVLFDVDGTLTPPREEATEEILEFLQRLKEKVHVGIVGGSDLVKQQEQMGRNIVNEVLYSFSENGLVAYKNGELLSKQVLQR
jgi:phosphomannomutase